MPIPDRCKAAKTAAQVRRRAATNCMQQRRNASGQQWLGPREKTHLEQSSCDLGVPIIAPGASAVAWWVARRNLAVCSKRGRVRRATPRPEPGVTSISRVATLTPRRASATNCYCAVSAPGKPGVKVFYNGIANRLENFCRDLLSTSFRRFSRPNASRHFGFRSLAGHFLI